MPRDAVSRTANVGTVGKMDFFSMLAEKYFYDYSQIERNTIVVTVFHLIMNPRESRWVPNQKENCHYDHIPFSVKKSEKISLSPITLTEFIPQKLKLEIFQEI